MISRKSFLRIAGITFGGIGLVVCLASMIILWITSTRLGHATDGLFGKMDNSLAGIRQRVIQTQQRVAAAKLNTEELGETLRDWTRQDVARRLALQLNAADRVERLTSTLQQSDLWLEVAESSLGFVQDVVSMNSSTGAPTEATIVSQLLVEVASLRAQLAEATETVARIHDCITDTGEEQSAGERFEQAVQFALRVVAALGSLDSRLERFADRISAAQSNLQIVKDATQWWHRLTTILITLLILWMAAGQAALCRLSWISGARTQSL